MSRYRFQLVGLMVLVSFGSSWSLDIRAAAAAHSKSPNIVIILVDDMGYGDAECYNSESKIPTPTINQLARDGMRFTDAHAAGPLCHMSRYGLLTGRYPFRTDVSRWPNHPLITSHQITIASLLASNNYETAMVGKWHLGFEENGYDQPLPGGPVDRGFDSFFGIRASTDIPPYFYIRDNQAVSPPTDTIQGPELRKGGVPFRVSSGGPVELHRALSFKMCFLGLLMKQFDVIQRHEKKPSDQPLFLYLAYPAPHTPWLPAKAISWQEWCGHVW